MTGKRCVNTRSLGAIVSLVGLNALGCTTEETQPPCTWVYSPDECEEPQTNDEIGTSSDGDDAEGEGPACIVDYDGSSRILHQCNGNIAASISFTALGDSCAEILGGESACEELHVFGQGHEPYEMAKVIACCDPYGVDSDPEEYLMFCAADMAQQICSSVSTRIKKLIDGGEIPKTAESVAMQKYIATHLELCFQALWGENGATQAGEVLGSWTIPNKPAWSALIKDFTVTVDGAAVTHVTLPADPMKYIECTGNDYNDVEIFEQNAPSVPGVATKLTLASTARVSVVGPMVMGGRITSSESLASRATDCEGPWCSSAEIAVDSGAGTWRLEDMSIYVEGAATFDNGRSAFEVERASIRLYETSPGIISRDSVGAASYEVHPGSAYFVMSGLSSGGAGLFVVSNSSSIIAHQTGSVWSFEAFSLEHRDGNGAIWTLVVAATTWD